MEVNRGPIYKMALVVLSSIEKCTVQKKNLHHIKFVMHEVLNIDKIKN
jgi:hypothetical protein